MSDYTTPAVTDSAVKNLAEAIDAFAQNTYGDLSEIKDTIEKYYTVNHESKIELPFEAEYDYIYNKVNGSITDADLKTISHIFLSGYLKSGDTITFKPYSDNVNEQDNYSAFYINGEKIQLGNQKQYICKAETGAREKLDILILGCPKVSNIYKARFVVDYADIPLKDFKMILFDDVDEPINPDIDSFLASRQIDTLKCIGNLTWKYTGLCTLRRLEVTRDIIVTSTMDCPCIKELIIPNVTSIPKLPSWQSITELDIRNFNGNINYIDRPSLTEDLVLNCRYIDRLTINRPITVNLGNSCVGTNDRALMNSSFLKLIGGTNLASPGASAFSNIAVPEIDFSKCRAINYSVNCFLDSPTIKTVKFGGVKGMASSAFTKCTSLTNLIFAGKSISCNLYFGDSSMLTEESCLNIINAIADGTKITVQLHSVVKTQMTDNWYCKLLGDKYVSCTASDDGAITQAAALIARGGTLT